MTAVSTSQETLSDAELISAVRGGDLDAYGKLFERHADAARRLARQLVSPGDADDLVSEAFVKVLTVLQRGGGPDVAFRAYLLTAVRRLRVDRLRAGAKLHTTDDMEAFDPGVPFRDTAVEGFENAAAAKAFASLPERWQLVLWHTEVEGSKPADIAPLLGMSANSVSALAYRAREGLRQAFLSQHAAELEDDTCRWTHQQLGAYVRNAISRRDAAKVEGHLQECRPCTAVYLELTEVNSNLSAILAPLLLGGLATAYVASVSTVAPAGVALVLGRLRDLVVHHAAASAVAGVASTVAVVGAVAVISGGSPARAPVDPVAAPSLAPTSPADIGSVEPAERRRKAPRRSASAVVPVSTPVVVTIPVVDATPAAAPTAPDVEPTPTPSETPEPTPTPSPTTSAPTPTPTTTVTPSVTPTTVPTTDPTVTPTVDATATPTVTTTPTVAPTESPTATPSETPSETPTDTPTVTPTEAPAPVDLDLTLGDPTPVPDRRNEWQLSATVNGLPSGMTGVLTFTGVGVSTMDADAPGCSRSDGNRTVTCEFTANAFSVTLSVTAPQGGTVSAEVTAIPNEERADNNVGEWIIPAPTAAP